MKKLQTRIQAIKKNDKKGFTLVELIVVLVILAILMAILIPSFTGYIAKARKTAAQLEARTVLMGMQSVLAEDSEDGQVNPSTTQVAKGNTYEYILNGALTDDGKAELEKYTELSAEQSAKVTSITVSNTDNVFKLTGFQYTASNGTVLKYDGTKIEPTT